MDPQSIPDTPTTQAVQQPEPSSPSSRPRFQRLRAGLCGCLGGGGFNADVDAPVANRAPRHTNWPETYEIAYSWGQSFEKLLQYQKGQKLFAEFLKGEFSDENILFWQACEELKREKNMEKVEEKARIIYEDFISILSPKEISLDSRVREIVNTNMGRPSASTFDEAQMQIYQLMQRDSYPRFLASSMYKEMLQNYGMTEEAV